MVKQAWVTGALFSTLLFFPAAAHAGIEACGDVHVEAEAECEVLTEGGCTAQCEPVNMTASCAADLRVTCDGTCTASATVDCNTTCQGSCVAECDVDPGQFDCSASCQASCEGNCDGSCSAAANQAECHASCEATCSSDCDAHCDVTPPEADCESKCNASCEGSCTAEANMDCQVDCQSSGYADCTSELSGGCQTHCEEPDGALFCDGQYVDHGDNLEECIGALQAELDITVEGYAEGECSGNQCHGEAGCSAECGTAPSSPRGAGSAVALLAVAAAFLARRRST